MPFGPKPCEHDDLSIPVAAAALALMVSAGVAGAMPAPDRRAEPHPPQVVINDSPKPSPEDMALAIRMIFAKMLWPNS